MNIVVEYIFNKAELLFKWAQGFWSAIVAIRVDQ